MHSKTEILNYIKGVDTSKRIVSVAITPAYVQEYYGASEYRPADYVRLAEEIDLDPILPVPLEFEKLAPVFAWKEIEHRRNPDGEYIVQELATPKGTLRRGIEIKPGVNPWIPEAPIQTEKDFEVLAWYLENIPAYEKEIYNELRSTMETIGERGVGVVSILLPFEAMLFIACTDTPLMYLDYSETYHRVMDLHQEVNKFLAKVAIRAGVDMIAMGSAGYELLSPPIFEQGLLPYAVDFCRFIRENGGMSYFHMCGHSMQIVRQGHFNKIKPNFLETLSPPPCGIVKDLKEARDLLDPEICTRGNLPVELLLTGPVAEIERRVAEIIRKTVGYKHIIGIADTVLPGTPLENIRAMIRFARRYHE